jgi:enediyne biosynthesis protein E4
VMMVGNSYASETTFGWYDASTGVVLLGNGKGGFASLGYGNSGFFVDGDAKAAAEVMVDDTRSLLLVTQNNDKLEVFESTRDGCRNVRLQPLDAYAVVTLADGSTQRAEFYYGSSYLSQSSRFLALPASATRAVIYDYAGKSRSLAL